tara:strand:+ start:106590 stop:106898 length:309 start_codon:yes stop_codon:yes gene_type:complete
MKYDQAEFEKLALYWDSLGLDCGDEIEEPIEFLSYVSTYLEDIIRHYESDSEILNKANELYHKDETDMSFEEIKIYLNEFESLAKKTHVLSMGKLARSEEAD